MQQEAPDHIQIRFEAELPRQKEGEAYPSDELGLDRIPGPDGTFRVLITAEDAMRLLERGMEVRLLKAHKVQPLDPKLIMTDEAAKAAIEEQTKGIARQEGE